jgi:GTP-binding protein
MHLKAPGGEHGMGKCCHGKNAKDLVIPVPLSTVVKKPDSKPSDPNDGIIYELLRDGELFIAARGGAGGHGNHYYLSNMVRKPLKAEQGGFGETVKSTQKYISLQINPIINLFRPCTT